jgi:hypothetical protein
MRRPTLILLICLFTAVTASGGGNIQTKPVTPNTPTATARIVQANYCFAEEHGILPERLPVPPLVLRVRFQVSYHAGNSRPLILPLDHQLTVWMSQTPGVMKILHQPAGLMDPSLKMMRRLPADVNPASPLDPKNDVFGVIPAGGDLTAPVIEEVTMQIYKKSLRHPIDLRGRRVYLKLQLDHQSLSPDLEAQLSDRWTRFGVPWTGGLRTNTLVFDVPATPQATKCADIGEYHPARQRL